MAKVQIETTQNVLIDFELGELGDRIGAAVIDEIVKGLYILLLVFINLGILNNDLVNILDSSVPMSILYVNFILFLPVIFYYPVIEYFWGGKTVGKHFLKLKVIHQDGSKPSIGDFLIRFFFRTIDTQGGFLIAVIAMDTLGSSEFVTLLVFLFTTPLPVIGMIAIGMTKNNQRIGDLLSGTIVVKMKQRKSLDDTLLMSINKKYTPVIPNVLRLSDRDIRMIKEALDLYEKNGNPKHVNILASKTKEILDVKGSYEADKLLKLVIRDYNILAVENA